MAVPEYLDIKQSKQPIITTNMADLKRLDSIAIESTPKEIAFRASIKANPAQRKYNVHVALRLLQYIEDTPGMNQTKLANKLGKSSAYISRVINGKENLSLDTVAEYEQLLDGYSLLPNQEKKSSQLQIIADNQKFSEKLEFSKLYKKVSTYVRSEANIVYAW